MPTVRRMLVVGLCVFTLAAACWGRYAETNDQRAYFALEGHAYRVEMKGWRFPLVHDPLSLLLARTHQESLTMELPRIEGVIDGTEIPVASDHPRYIGRVVITKRKMSVDLYYDTPGEQTRRPLPWNDEYKLVQKDAGRTP